MSRIYFRSQSGEAEVRGWERAHGAHLCNSMALIALGLDDPRDLSTVLRVIPPDSYVHAMVAREPESRRAIETVRTWIVASMDGNYLLGDRRVSTFSVALNTAWAMGSDPIRLLARLHGQCEIHAYVEGPDRAWLAGIIEQGRAAGIMRKESGWEDVVALLRARDDEPVVTSYSVCEQFPNACVARWEPPIDEAGEQDTDAWYDLSDEERWTLALTGLRSGDHGRGLRMAPATWAAFRFDDGTTALDVRAYCESMPA